MQYIKKGRGRQTTDNEKDDYSTQEGSLASLKLSYKIKRFARESSSNSMTKRIEFKPLVLVGNLHCKREREFSKTDTVHDIYTREKAKIFGKQPIHLALNPVSFLRHLTLLSPQTDINKIKCMVSKERTRITPMSCIKYDEKKFASFSDCNRGRKTKSKFFDLYQTMLSKNISFDTACESRNNSLFPAEIQSNPKSNACKTIDPKKSYLYIRNFLMQKGNGLCGLKMTKEGAYMKSLMNAQDSFVKRKYKECVDMETA